MGPNKGNLGINDEGYKGPDTTSNPLKSPMLGVQDEGYKSPPGQEEQQREKIERIRKIVDKTEDPEGEIENIFAADYIGQIIGKPTEHVYQNLDVYGPAYFNQEKLEKTTWHAAADEFRRGMKSIELSKLGLEMMLNPADPEIYKEYEKVLKEMPEPDTADRNILEKVVVGAATIYPSMGAVLGNGLITGTAGAAIGGMAGYALTGPAGAAAMAKKGFEIGRKVGTFNEAFALSGGGIFSEVMMLQVPGTDKRMYEIYRDADPYEQAQISSIARVAALSGGAVSAASELAFDSFARLTGASKGFIGEATDKIMKQILKGGYVTKAVGRAIALHGAGAGEEAVQEVIQELAEKGAQETAKYYLNKAQDLGLEMSSSEEWITQLTDVAKQTYLGMLGVGLPGAVVNVYGDGAAAIVDRKRNVPKGYRKTENSSAMPISNIIPGDFTAKEVEQAREIRADKTNGRTKAPIKVYRDQDGDLIAADASYFVALENGEQAVQVEILEGPITKEQAAKAKPAWAMKSDEYAGNRQSELKVIENSKATNTLEDLKYKIRQNFPQATAEEHEGMGWLVEMGAAAQGLSPDEYVQKTFSQETFTQARLPSSKKAGVQFLEDGKALIHLTEQSDVSSFVHEYGHIVRRQLNESDQKVLLDHFGAKDWAIDLGTDPWGSAEEKFARAFETYLQTGQAPSPEVQTVFQRIAEALRKVYGAIMKSGYELDAPVKEVLDRYFSTHGETQKNTAEPATFAAQERKLFQPSKKEEIRRFLDGEAIAETSGDIVPELNKITEIATWADKWVEEQNKKDLRREDIGEIELTRRGFKDSLSHGLTKEKIQGIPILPEVISKGMLIFEGEKGPHTGRVIAAPVKIAGIDYIELVLLRQHGENSNKLYVHEVIIKEKVQGASKPIEAVKPDGHHGLLKSIIQELYSVNDDIEKAGKWLHSIGVQFPKENTSHGSSKNSIIRKSDIVKQNPDILFQPIEITEEDKKDLHKIVSAMEDQARRSEEKIKAGNTNVLTLRAAKVNRREAGRYKRVVDAFIGGERIFHIPNDDQAQTAVIHPASRDGWEYQISYFDDRGPWTHINTNTIAETMNEFFKQYGAYEPGRPTNNILFQPAGDINSKEFKAWFGDSKVTNPDGSPKVMYHGTASEIEQFIDQPTTNGKMWGDGFYFTESEKDAEFWASQTGGDIVKEVYLSIEKPLLIDESFYSEKTTVESLPTDFQEWIVKTHNDPIVKKALDGKFITGFDVAEFTKKIQDYAIEYGYDGVIGTFGENQHVVAFESTQVKSVNNQGSWDANDPRILFQPADPVESENFKNWFGDWETDPENASKVVTENGVPMVVYHNTDADFEAFNPGTKDGLSGKGIYFSTYPLGQYGKNQIEAYLNIRNPITRETELDGMREINSSGIPTKFIPDIFEKFPQFDGIINRSEIVVKDPTQVKSVNNTGSWSKDDPRILFQEAGPIGSKNFTNWFGASKIVDENGDPLVVYHGTMAEKIEAFGKEKRSFSNAHRLWYFTKDRETADIHSMRTGNILEVYLSIQNPKVLSMDQIDAIEDIGYWATDEQLDEFESQGYDGLMLEDMSQIVALKPTQIKSINNTGTFDPTDPRILFQSAEHEQIIKTAVEEFKPVPEDVLLEYADRPWAAKELKRREVLKDYAWLEDWADTDYDEETGKEGWEIFKEKLQEASDFMFSEEEQGAIVDLGGSDDRFYKEIWSRANLQSRDEANAKFIENYATKEGVMSLAAEIVTDMKRWSGSGMPGTIWKLANNLAWNNGTKDAQVEAAINSIKNNPTQVRRALAAVYGEQLDLMQIQYEDEIEEATPYKVKIDRLSDDERMKLYAKTEDLEIRKMLLDKMGKGTDQDTLQKMDKAVTQKMGTLKAEQTKAMKEMEAKLEKESRDVAFLRKRIREKEAEYEAAKEEDKAAHLEEIKALKKKHKAAEKKIREQKNAKLEKVTKEIRAAQKRKDEIKKVKALSRRLAKNITKPPAKTCHIEFKKKILEFQEQIGLDPNYRRKSTLEEFAKVRDRVLMDPDAANNYDKKYLETAFSKPLNQWTLPVLEQVNEKMNALRKDGRIAFQEEMETRRRNKRRDIDNIILEVLDHDPIGTIFAEGTKEREEEKKTKLKTLIDLSTLTPSRLLSDMAGENSRLTDLFVEEINAATDDELVRVRSRQEKMKQIREKLEISEKSLAEYLNGPNGQLTVDQVIHLWTVRDNTDNMRAIIYGNNGISSAISLYTDQLTRQHRRRTEMLSGRTLKNTGKSMPKPLGSIPTVLWESLTRGTFPMFRTGEGRGEPHPSQLLEERLSTPTP
jgi:hypothetical protein